MPLSETEKRPGLGASRFLVRGRGYLDLAAAAVLRESYNEYPSRFPLNPEFPAPGRRGASRPKPDQSAPGAPAPGSGGGTYPATRPREERTAPFVGILGSEKQGESFFNSPGVVTGTDRVINIGRAWAPFLVTHVMYWGANTTPNAGDGIGLKILADPSGSTSGDFDTATGDVLEFVNSQSSNILEPFDVPMEHWPDIFYPQAAFVKAAWRNTIIGGNTPVYLIIDVKYLG